MKPVIITIGRQFGSGGHELGQKLAARLNIPFYDRALLSAAAEHSGLTRDMIESLDEQPTNSFLYSLSVGSFGFSGDVPMPLNNQVFLAMTKAIRDIAAEGSCVIVGRYAEYVLQDNENLVRVFVHADKASRVRRIMEKRGLNEKDAQALMNKTDKKRASYHDFYCDEKWGVTTSYDLSVNSALLGIDAAVDMIAHYVENR